jgi:hypothetical protein
MSTLDHRRTPQFLEDWNQFKTRYMPSLVSEKDRDKKTREPSIRQKTTDTTWRGSAVKAPQLLPPPPPSPPRVELAEELDEPDEEAEESEDDHRPQQSEQQPEVLTFTDELRNKWQRDLEYHTESHARELQKVQNELALLREEIKSLRTALRPPPVSRKRKVPTGPVLPRERKEVKTAPEEVKQSKFIRQALKDFEQRFPASVQFTEAHTPELQGWLTAVFTVEFGGKGKAISTLKGNLSNLITLIESCRKLDLNKHLGSSQMDFIRKRLSGCLSNKKKK